MIPVNLHYALVLLPTFDMSKWEVVPWCKGSATGLQHASFVLSR